jgi:hypothetical protein
MKQYDKFMRWDLNLSIHGYGRNIKEGLMSALETFSCNIDLGADWQEIERDAVIRISEGGLSKDEEDDFKEFFQKQNNQL